MSSTEAAGMLSTVYADFVAMAGALTDAQWQVASWCPGWTVHDVIAHVAFHVHRESIADLVGSTPRRTDLMLARHEATTRDGLLAFLATPRPPKAETMINVCEVVVHSQDVRGPLGLPATVASGTMGACLDYCTGRVGTVLVVGRKTRVARGVHLRASDIEWEQGRGPEVRGRALALLMAAAGRAEAFAELSGPGVATMVARVDVARATVAG